MDEFSWLYDIGFIRWISGFFTEEKLGPIFRWFNNQLSGRTPAQIAGKLFWWAVVLVLLAGIIDQAVYWTRRDQQSKARRFIAHVRILWRRFYRFMEHKIKAQRLAAGRRR